jgi:hypothetical protein
MSGYQLVIEATESQIPNRVEWAGVTVLNLDTVYSIDLCGDPTFPVNKSYTLAAQLAYSQTGPDALYARVTPGQVVTTGVDVWVSPGIIPPPILGLQGASPGSPLPVSIDLPDPLPVSLTGVVEVSGNTAPNSETNPVFVDVTNSGSVVVLPEFRYCVLGATTDPVTVVPAPAIGQTLKIVRSEVVPNTAAAGGYLETSNGSLVVGMARIGQPHDSEWETPQGLGYVSILGHGASVGNPLDFAVHVNIQGALLPPGGAFAIISLTAGAATQAYDLTTGTLLWTITGETIANQQTCLSPSGKLLATFTTGPNKIWLWNVWDGGAASFPSFPGPAAGNNIVSGQWATETTILISYYDSSGNYHIICYNATTGAVVWGPIVNTNVLASAGPSISSSYPDAEGYVWWTYSGFTTGGVQAINAATGALGTFFSVPAGFYFPFGMTVDGGDACVGGINNVGQVLVMTFNTSTQTITTQVDYALTGPDAGGVWASTFITDGIGQVWAGDNVGGDWIITPSSGAAFQTNVPDAFTQGTLYLSLKNFVGSNQFISGITLTTSGTRQYVGLLDVEAYSITVTPIRVDTIGSGAVLACCTLNPGP